jgi:hypothetical protein
MGDAAGTDETTMVMGIQAQNGPTVFNAHERVLPASTETVGALLDRLGGPGDTLWPSDRWPAMRLDRELAVGARGGHGPMRYHVVAYEPGRFVRFRFSGPPGFLGHHEFLVEHATAGGRQGTLLRHVLTLNPVDNARLSWALVWRPLHDALLEDLLDRAESLVTGRPVPARPWSWWVRTLRRWLPSARWDGRGRPAGPESNDE